MPGCTFISVVLGNAREGEMRAEWFRFQRQMHALVAAGANLLQQQAKFDAFVEQFNCERPHEVASGNQYRTDSSGSSPTKWPCADRMAVLLRFVGAGRLQKQVQDINDSVADGSMPRPGCPEGVWDSAKQQQFLKDFQAWKEGRSGTEPCVRQFLSNPLFQRSPEPAATAQLFPDLIQRPHPLR